MKHNYFNRHGRKLTWKTRRYPLQARYTFMVMILVGGGSLMYMNSVTMFHTGPPLFPYMQVIQHKLSMNVFDSNTKLTFCQMRGSSNQMSHPRSNMSQPNEGDGLSSSRERKSNAKGECLVPQLDPCDPQIMPFDGLAYDIVCPQEDKNWVYVENGTFKVLKEAEHKHGSISCVYAPVIRSGDFNAEIGRERRIEDGSPIEFDFFQVKCTSLFGATYTNYHLGASYKRDLHKRLESTPLPSTALGGYNVYIMGFDSVSRMAWTRSLPQTRDYFVNTLGGIELEGQNILGDGTVQALLPMLSGKLENKLPTSRRDNPKAKYLDNYPFIWKDFKKAGYVTAYGEDGHYYGTFQYRLKGFKREPVDHYMRHFFIADEPTYSRHPKYCYGSELRHIRFFNYFRDIIRMYATKRKFLFAFHSEMTHGDNSELNGADASMKAYIKELNDSGVLDNTILIMMADHGSRFSQVRATQQGKLEERMPYFGFRFPPTFIKAYPQKVEQLRENAKHLTTMYDIHETLQDLLDSSPFRPSRTDGFGISLFKPIPKTRSCADAGVERHWCACLNWENITHDSETKEAAGAAIIDFFNQLTERVRSNCEVLNLTDILSLTRFRPEENVLKFSKSIDMHGDIPDLSNTQTLSFEYLQATIVTSPGDGRFEVTLKHNVKSGTFTIQASDISRTNKYGKAPACIEDKFPSLRPYCYCRS